MVLGVRPSCTRDEVGNPARSSRDCSRIDVGQIVEVDGECHLTRTLSYEEVSSCIHAALTMIGRYLDWQSGIA